MSNSSLLINQGTNSSINFDLAGGTNTQVIAIGYGTISTIGTLPNLPGGTVTLSNPTGTTVQFNNGTLNVGTVTANGGTIGVVQAGTINAATAVLNSGTINLGTFVMPSGTVTVLPNLPQGSINVTAGTIATLGTMGTLGLVNTVTTVSNITNGSIVQTVGTVNTGTINLGTVVGKDANAAAQVGNPIGVGGTDSGGTIRTIKVDSGGLQRIGLDSGTVSVLPNLPQGSIQVTAGTVVMNSGTINVSTISTLPNLPQGSINVTAGTIATLGTMGTLGLVNTVTTVSNITNGSIVQTVGTVNTGTINTGTINVGTIRLDRPSNNFKTFGTQVAFSGAAAATIVGSASVGAGTSVWMNEMSLFNIQSGAGTFILGFGTAQQGTNVLLRAPIGTTVAPGIEKTWPQLTNAGMTNQDLVLSATGAGTVDLSISYLISV